MQKSNNNFKDMKTTSLACQYQVVKEETRGQKRNIQRSNRKTEVTKTKGAQKKKKKRKIPEYTRQKPYQTCFNTEEPKMKFKFEV